MYKRYKEESRSADSRTRAGRRRCDAPDARPGIERPRSSASERATQNHIEGPGPLPPDNHHHHHYHHHSVPPGQTVAQQAHCYKMDHARRGTALIFNNETFDAHLQLGSRPGSDRDASNMEAVLREMGFRTVLRNDCSKSEMVDTVLQAAEDCHRDADCLACVILSHGDDGVVYGRDAAVDVDSLVAPFKTCPSLAGKPKLFFIQACRGTKLDDGVDVVDAVGIPGGQDEEEEDKAGQADAEARSVGRQTIPVEADFLMAYSAVQGFYSWRNQEKGSWFVQTLTDVLRDNWRRMDLLTIMTRVSFTVARAFQSHVPDPDLRWLHGKKQVPCITSMLTKDLYFTPKQHSAGDSDLETEKRL